MTYLKSRLTILAYWVLGGLRFCVFSISGRSDAVRRRVESSQGTDLRMALNYFGVPF